MSSQHKHSDKNVFVAVLSSCVVAGLLLILFVLPAELGIDPLGTGKALGLVELSGKSSNQIIAQNSSFNQDSETFVLSPFESVEYKYRIEESGTLLYSWHATGEVLYDFHAEPDGAPAEFAESFDQQRRRDSHGSYVARFSGIHGWYWENRGNSEVVISLSTTGFYSKAIEFRDGLVLDKPISALHGGAQSNQEINLVK